MEVERIHNIDLRKSPLSGPHISPADARRRRYAHKCKRTLRLAGALNDEARSLDIELWDPRPSFEAGGAKLKCRWSGKLRLDKELCDLAIARIGRELRSGCRSGYKDAKALADDRRELEFMLAELRTLKTNLIKESLYGRKPEKHPVRGH